MNTPIMIPAKADKIPITDIHWNPNQSEARANEDTLESYYQKYKPRRICSHHGGVATWL